MTKALATPPKKRRPANIHGSGVSAISKVVMVLITSAMSKAARRVTGSTGAAAISAPTK